MTDLAEKVWRGTEHGVDWRNRFMSGLPAHLDVKRAGVDWRSRGPRRCMRILSVCNEAGVRSAARPHRGRDAGRRRQRRQRFALARRLQCAAGAESFREVATLPPRRGRIGARRRRGDPGAQEAGRRDCRRQTPYLGVIRGVGLSNDGRGRGLLVPSQEGQERAMRLAYEMAELEPQDISLVECHATGTSRGDLTELMSMASIFAGMADVPIGSLKSNLGHSITASGAAAAIKVLAAMRAGVRPPTLHVDDPLPFIADSPFRLLAEAEPWACIGPRRAAINNFGFGGNNAHLLLEEWIRLPASTKRAEMAGNLAPCRRRHRDRRAESARGRWTRNRLGRRPSDDMPADSQL